MRVACLTCFGAIAGIQPPLMEVCHIIQSSKPPVTNRLPVEVDKQTREPESGDSVKSLSVGAEKDSGFSSSPNVAVSPFESGVFDYSGGTTPNRGTFNSSGVMTPVVYGDGSGQGTRDVSWLVKLCVKNILPQKSPDTVFGNEDLHLEPLPVRLESLQVLANLTKGYFPVIR